MVALHYSYISARRNYSHRLQHASTVDTRSRHGKGNWSPPVRTRIFLRRYLRFCARWQLRTRWYHFCWCFRIPLRCLSSHHARSLIQLVHPPQSGQRPTLPPPRYGHRVRHRSTPRSRQLLPYRRLPHGNRSGYLHHPFTRVAARKNRPKRTAVCNSGYSAPRPRAGCYRIQKQDYRFRQTTSWLLQRSQATLVGVVACTCWRSGSSLYRLYPAAEKLLRMEEYL